MAGGSDKRITYDPPGAIGLVDRGAVIHLRFDEENATTRPSDAAGNLDELDAGPINTTDMPDLVDGVLGRARAFDGVGAGLTARDIDPGSTLLTRDMSIQVVLTWDAATQAAGDPGFIICRGLGVLGPTEYVCYGLRIDVVDASSFRGKLRWLWQDLAGAEHLAPGVEVVIPPNQYTMLTATRRWASPTQVELSYYVGDQLLGSETSANGSIGGGTTGATMVGFRAAASDANFYAGNIDQLMVIDRELCAEEIEDTWLRLTVYQPRGVQLFKQLMDKDMPISDELDSDAQKEIAMAGIALGFSASRVENLRNNFLPGRAYGSTLEQWEQAVAVTPQPAQDLAARRERVVARFRQKRGVSIDGMGDALSGLVDCDVADLEFLAFSNTIEDDFDTLEAMRWDTLPSANGSWASTAGKAVATVGVTGKYQMEGVAPGWLSCRTSVSQSKYGDTGREHVMVKLALGAHLDGFEMGVFFGDSGRGNWILCGCNDKGAGNVKVNTQTIVDRVAAARVAQVTLVTTPLTVWLHLYETTVSGIWKAAWSTTGPTTGFTTSPDITFPTGVHWAGLYARTLGSATVVAASTATFDDFVLFTPFGSRPCNAYVSRDPGLGGTPDLEGAHSVIQGVKHAYTHATIITSKNLLCDNIESGCDRGPMGAL